ncbi:hypothetical protein BY458DRAFT_500778 [Sporodiniella umbellata]|nr:hypothetical protein BY458DRAFT_500778 [Sporodiniella umbellata]
MPKIIDYCLNTPRLLTLRDSPLRILQNPKLPFAVVQEWYIGNSLDYIESTITVLLDQWDNTFKIVQQDEEQVTSLFIQLIHSMHERFQHTQLVLNMSFSEDDALGSLDLKRELKRESIGLIQRLVSDRLEKAQWIYCQYILNCLHQRYRMNPYRTFSFLFVPGLKYQGKDLELVCRQTLDLGLTRLSDMLSLNGAFIARASQEAGEPDSLDEDSLEILKLAIPLHTVDLAHLEAQCQTFQETFEKINDLSLNPNWVGLVHQLVQEKLSQWDQDEEQSMVEELLKWLHVLILPWLSYMLPNKSNLEDNWIEFLRHKTIAEHVIYQAVYQKRIVEVLDIILDYPDSKNALLDLKITANKRGLLHDLQEKLIQEFQDRLFHLGVSVCDILEYYTLCVRCLREIDPSCNILMSVTEIIHDYLSTHRINIAKDVADIIKEPEAHHVELCSNHDNIFVFTKEELNAEATTVKLDPKDQDILGNLRKLQIKSADITATLISLCNPLKDFVDAYSDKLRDALFYTENYNVDTEIRSLEVLKLNFPPDTFTRCDIMLRDISDSKRTDKAIHENPTIDPSFHPIIISKKYWLGDEEDDDDDSESESPNEALLQLWPEYSRNQEKYMEEYMNVKASRRLRFLKNMGTVTLDLVFESGVKTFVVRPEAAAIIRLFEEDALELTKQEIMETLRMDKKVVVDCLNLWKEKKVLKLSSNGRFSLIES